MSRLVKGFSFQRTIDTYQAKRDLLLRERQDLLRMVARMDGGDLLDGRGKAEENVDFRNLRERVKVFLVELEGLL